MYRYIDIDIYIHIYIYIYICREIAIDNNIDLDIGIECN
jgi:hypothetical protein